jgi:hypothetical protein
MRVQKRRSARPEKAERSETTTPLTYIIAEGLEVTSNSSVNDTAARKRIGECPLCHSPGKLTVEPRRSGPPWWWVNCWTAGCRALGSGEWAREVAALVGAPGGGALLADPLLYLGDYLETETRTDREPEQLPSFASIDGRASRLFTVPDAIDHLLTERGLTERTVRRARVGWDGSAFTFPIYNGQGELVNLIRRPWPDAPDGRKYVTLRGRNRHNGGVELYPRPLPPGSWLLCEGLADALLGRQHGLPAVTSTHGVDTFLDEWLPMVRGKRVACMYDVGAEPIMHKRVAQLCAAGAQAWPVELGKVLREGKDLSDALTGGWTAEALIEFINSERDARRRRQAA